MSGVSTSSIAYPPNCDEKNKQSTILIISSSMVEGRRLVVVHSTVHCKSCLWHSTVHDIRREADILVARGPKHWNMNVYLVTIHKHTADG